MMTFEYNSECSSAKKALSNEVVRDLRCHLIDAGFCRTWTTDQLMDCLLDYRYYDTGERLMINHLEPVFTYLARGRQLWSHDFADLLPEEEDPFAPHWAEDLCDFIAPLMVVVLLISLTWLILR